MSDAIWWRTSWGYGERLDELFAGRPSLMVAKTLLHSVVMNSERLGVMVFVVNSAFLYGRMRRKVYIELPGKDLEAKNHNNMVKLIKAIYRTRDAPQRGEVRREIVNLAFYASVSAHLRTPSRRRTFT